MTSSYICVLLQLNIHVSCHLRKLQCSIGLPEEITISNLHSSTARVGLSQVVSGFRMTSQTSGHLEWPSHSALSRGSMCCMMHLQSCVWR